LVKFLLVQIFLLTGSLPVPHYLTLLTEYAYSEPQYSVSTSLKY